MMWRDTREGTLSFFRALREMAGIIPSTGRQPTRCEIARNYGDDPSLILKITHTASREGRNLGVIHGSVVEVRAMPRIVNGLLAI